VGFAHTVDEIRSLRDQNTSGVLLNFTVPGNRNYDSNAILASASVFFQTIERTAVTYEYQLVFRLLDERRNPVLISNDVNRVGATSISLFDTVTLPLSRGEDNIVKNYELRFLPAVQLPPWETYTVELSLQKRLRSTDPFVDTGDVSLSVAKTYFHFPGLFTPDAAFNVLATLDNAAWTRAYLVKTVPGKNTFRANVDYTLQRFDDFLQAVKTDLVTVHFNYELRDVATDALVPLKASQATLLALLDSFVPTAIPNVNKPFVLTGSHTLNLEPTDGTQLDSVNNTYKLIVSIDHIDQTGQPPTAGNSLTLAPERLLHFNGHLFFGSIDTIFTSIDNTPPVNAVPPNAVRTELGVNGNSGFLVGQPGYTYGDGTDLSVVLRPNGNAEYVGVAPVILNGPSPDMEAVECVQFSRSNLMLTAAGVFGDLLVRFPTGFGIRPDLNSRVLKSTLNFPQVPLNQSLLPVGNPNHNTPFVACEESKPFWVVASALRWLVSEGRFLLTPIGIRYARTSELFALEAAPVAPALKVKLSNEQYFRFLNGIVSPTVSVSADAQCNARMTLTVSFAPGQFSTHFPHQANIAWAGAGTMVIQDDQVDPAGSLLTFASPVTVPYATDCFEPDCQPDNGTDILTLTPSAGELRFTVDGGLHASGTMTPAAPLNWGYIGTINHFAHRTDPFTAGSFHMPGCFLRGDQAPPSLPNGPAHDAPGVLLLTGVAPGNLATLERPETTAYNAPDVAGDYAGMNFVVGPGVPPKKGESYLAAKQNGPYDLRSRCKYYARFWGVSGIHEAEPGTFDPKAQLAGYSFNINHFSLSFLGSQNEESRTEGYITLPWPAECVQKFKELTFLCNGALDKAIPPPGEATLTNELKYWHGDFITLGIEFKRCANGDCDPNQSFLVLGVEAFSSNIEAPLFGELGLRPNGNIITPAFAASCGLPISSRLQTDNNLPLVGFGVPYNFMPVIEAYYNNYDYIPSPDKTPLGFLNFAGKLDTAFFEDAKVQLHTAAKAGNATQPFYVMGGWNRPGKGWEINSQHYFNDDQFDADHQSYDTAVSAVSQYRKDVDPGNDQHLVRVERRWLGVVDFEFPVYWSPTLRYFQSQSFTSSKNQAVGENLLVVDTSASVHFLDALQTDFEFGAGVEALSLVDVASLGITELTGNLFTGDLLDDLNVVKDALAGLNSLLNDDLHDFFAAPFDALLTQTVVDLHGELLETYQQDQKNFSTPPGTTIKKYCLKNANYGGSFEAKFEDLMGSIQDPFSTISTIYDTLGTVTNALGKVQKILDKNPNTGKRQSISEMVGSSAPDFVKDNAPAIDGAVQKAEATLDKLHFIAGELQKTSAFLRTLLNGAGAEWAQEMNDAITILKNSGAIHTVCTNSESDINVLIGTLDLSIDDPNTVLDPVKIKKQIRQIVENRFFSSGIPTALQHSFKQRLYDKDVAIRHCVDSMFATGNGIVRALVAAALAEASDEISPALGKLATTMQTARLHGSASIKGDSLKYLRLDANVNFDLGAKLAFDAYLEISERDSSGSDLEAPCEPSSGGSWTEVSMGANNVQLGWISPLLVVNVNTKFSFTDPPGPDQQPTLINLMGDFSVAGELKFETFAIKEVGFAFAIGEIQTHIAAKVRAEFNKKEMAAGFFAGKTCVDTPLRIANENFADALGNVGSSSPFTGFYGYAEAWYPLNELIGVPSSCFFNVRGGVGMGVFVNANGPVFGGQIHYGLSGEVLCLLDIQGEIDLVGFKKGDDYTFKGTGTVSGELGICPLCEDFSKSVSMTVWVHLEPTPGGIGDTSVDWSVDF
jgi:hypothetical protein